MLSGFKSQCVPTYHLLTPEQIKSIHTATLELLETVGVDVHHDGARQMLVDAGCRLKESSSGPDSQLAGGSRHPKRPVPDYHLQPTGQ